jgi:hypothetical protein
MKNCLTFDKILHQYYWDGRVIPSVTQVIGLTDLINLDGIPQAILANAGQRGTYVHDATELLDKNVLDWSSIEDEDYIGYVRAWQRFTTKHVKEIIEIEKRVCCFDKNEKPLYAGTLDRIVKLKDKRTALIDIKTARTLNQEAAGLQLAAYRKAYNNHIDVCLIVHLHDDGTYKLYELNGYEDHLHYFNLYLSYHHTAMVPIDLPTLPKMTRIYKDGLQKEDIPRVKDILNRMADIKAYRDKYNALDKELSNLLEGQITPITVGKWGIDGKFINRSQYNIPKTVKNEYKSTATIYKKEISKI